MVPLPPSFRRAHRTSARLLCCVACVAGLSAAEPDPVASNENADSPVRERVLSAPRGAFDNSRRALANLIDRLPDLPDLGLPNFDPSGAVRLYFRPRFGDLLHEDYFRMQFGGRVKVTDQLEMRTELGTYITHGFRDSVGNGLYQFRYGLKHEIEISPDAGWSIGLDWLTPLSRPPYAITDGVRHTLPYVTYTRTLSPKHSLVGFVTLGADLIDHTALRENFVENQLHTNSMILTLGIAREWRRMHVVLRVFDANTAPLSGGSDNVFGLRPSIGIPILRRPDETPRATVTFEGRAIWGPDGFETGVSTRVRFDLRYRRTRTDVQ